MCWEVEALFYMTLVLRTLEICMERTYGYIQYIHSRDGRLCSHVNSGMCEKVERILEGKYENPSDYARKKLQITHLGNA